MSNLLKHKSGMALVMVLSVILVIMVFGTAYIKNYTDTVVIGKFQLDRIQSDFFARGVQNIALFKIKTYPDFFIRAYRHKIYRSRIANGEALSAPLYNFNVFSRFMGTASASTILGGILNNAPEDRKDFIEPIDIATYSTEILVTSAKDFDSSAIEMIVSVQMNGRSLVNRYKLGVNAVQVASGTVEL